MINTSSDATSKRTQESNESSFNEKHDQLVKQLIKDVPDFPKKGVLFKDITPLLSNAIAMQYVCDQMASVFKGQGITKVLAIESRGFFFGTGIAERLGAGFVPVRKKGKLPRATVSESYTLEYGEAILEIHADAIHEGEKILIVDDVLATGGTMNATVSLVNQLKGHIVGASCFIELDFLKGREKLGQLNLNAYMHI